MKLDNQQKKQLRALAHPLKPVIIVGKQGISSSVSKETQRALHDHELIKVKFPAEEPLQELAQELAQDCQADVIATQGRIAILYKAHPKKPRIQL